MATTELDDVRIEGTHTGASAKQQDNPIDDAQADQTEIVLTAATVAVVGVGAAVFEAALLPGVVLGVAAMLVPRALPSVGQAINPLFRSTVRGAYKLGQRTKEMAAEAQEQVQDIVAEAKAEEQAAQATSLSKTGAPANPP
jgi:hypothetical protein